MIFQLFKITFQHYARSHLKVKKSEWYTISEFVSVQWVQSF